MDFPARQREPDDFPAHPRAAQQRRSSGVNVFLDTEFTDFRDCELISIGLVSEDGAYQFYAERSDFLLARCSDWTLQNVLPMLASTPVSRINRNELNQALLAWFASLPEPAVILHDHGTDWCLLAEALLNYGERCMPPQLASTQNIAALKKDAAFASTMQRYFDGGRPRHHALTEAQALRAGWLAWRCTQDVAGPTAVDASHG